MGYLTSHIYCLSHIILGLATHSRAEKASLSCKIFNEHRSPSWNANWWWYGPLYLSLSNISAVFLQYKDKQEEFKAKIWRSLHPRSKLNCITLCNCAHIASKHTLKIHENISSYPQRVFYQILRNEDEQKSNSIMKLKWISTRFLQECLSFACVPFPPWPCRWHALRNVFPFYLLFSPHIHNLCPETLASIF